MRILFLLIFVLLCLGVSAQELVYSKFTPIDLKIPCTYNNTPCSSQTICNITVNYPNSSVFIDNEGMTYNYGYFNYTLPDQEQAGEYSAYMFCNDTSEYGYSVFPFKISSQGQIDSGNTLSLVIGYGIMALILLLVAFMVGQDHFFIQLFFTVFAVIIAVLVIPSVFLSDLIPVTMFSLSTKYVFYLFGAYLIIYPIIYYTIKLIKGGEMEDNNYE